MVEVFLAIFLTSILSIILAIPFGKARKFTTKYSFILISFASGTLFGDAFIHLIPEAFLENPNSYQPSLFILLGIGTFFILEKFIHWQHCHEGFSKDHPHNIATMSFVGDTVHNFIDGVIIAGSFLISTPLGITTTVAVLAHEIPQEIADFSIMLYGGWKIKKALILNFISSLSSFAGAIIIILASQATFNILSALAPFTAGGFIYIAGSDLVPELKKHVSASHSLAQLIAMASGVLIMIVLLTLE